MKPTRWLKPLCILDIHTLQLSVLFLTLQLLLFTLPSLSHALDEGGAAAGIDYRSVDRETSSTKSRESEWSYHLDAWQNLPNAGRLLLGFDWNDARDGTERNRLGSGYLALKEFRFNGFILNGLIGDSTLYPSNLQEKFSNATYPDVYFRGGEVDFFSRSLEGQLFGGKVARLEGLLGRFYNITDESLYGFNVRFRPVSSLLVGTGFIRTQDEVDSVDRPVTKQNNIFLFDSELELLKGIKWVGEFRGSDFEGEQDVGSKRDYMVRVGPIVQTDTFRMEANFRRIGTDYRFVSDATQGERDQEGFFLLTEYRPSKSVVLFGNGDRSRDNVSERSWVNTTDTRRGLVGFSFHSSRYPSLYLTFDMAERKSRDGLPLPAEDLGSENNFSTTLSSEIQYQVGDFNPYLRYRRFDYEDHVFKTNESLQNVFTLGFRQDLKIGSSLYVEGEWDRKEFPQDEREERLSGKVGFYYSHSPKLSCWGEAIYSRLKDRGERARTDRVEAALGLSYELPWGVQIYGDFRYDTTFRAQRDEMEPRGIQATLQFVKRFQWGERGKVAGLRPGIETRGHGSIEGTVFNDINRNGRQERGEEGIKGITLRLEDASIVKTDEKGFYRFPRVESGTHYLTLDVKRIPAEYNIVSPEKRVIDIALRETVQADFRLIGAGRVEGRVIQDTDGDGKIDSGDKGLPDILILLEGAEINAYTDEEGKFTFENILPGEYLLKVDTSTLPDGSGLNSPDEIRIEVPPGGDLKDKDFLIYVKPRPILMGPPVR